jgi:hypothetical protein
MWMHEKRRPRLGTELRGPLSLSFVTEWQKGKICYKHILFLGSAQREI